MIVGIKTPSKLRRSNFQQIYSSLTFLQVTILLTPYHTLSTFSLFYNEGLYHFHRFRPLWCG